MHPRIAETLEYLDKERAELREAVELVPPKLRERQPGPDRWSVAQVLQHLALIESGIVKLLDKRIARARAEGVGPELETSSIMNSINVSMIVDRSRRVTAPETIRPQSDADSATAWTALEESRLALRAAVLTGDGLALGEVMHHHPVLGEINLYQWMLFVGGHEQRHTAQIREIADQLDADLTKTTTGAN